MKKIFLMTAVCLAFGAFSASAQSKMGVSVGAEVGLPMGDDFSTGNGIGFGGSAMFHYNLIEGTLDLTGSVGYLTFGGKTSTINLPPFPPSEITTPSISAIPIRIGANWFPVENLGLYAGVDLGLNLFTLGSTKQTVLGISVDVPGSSKTTFSFAPRIGYSLPIGDNALDLSVRYDLSPGFPTTETTEDPVTGQEIDVAGTTTLGFIGFRAAYRFNFGN